MSPTTLTPASSMSDADLATYLRKLAAMWFKNSDILVLEELIRRKAGPEWSYQQQDKLLTVYPSKEFPFTAVVMREDT